MQVHLDNI